MGKATEDEYRYAQYQRQHLPLTGELYSCCHNETAANSQQETSPRSLCQTTCQDLGSRLHTVRLGIGNEPCREQTTYNISEKHCQQHQPVALTTNETSCASIKFQTVIDHCGESEREEDSTCHTSYTEVNYTSDRDTDTSKNSWCKSFLKHRLF